MAVIFSGRHVDDPPKLTIDRTVLEWKKEARFLGVIFDSRMTWASHINSVVDRCRKRLNLMKCMSGQDWGADKGSRLQIYFSMIRSIMDYVMIWIKASESHPCLPSPTEFGWTLDATTKRFDPVRCLQPPAPEAMMKLVKCGC